MADAVVSVVVEQIAALLKEQATYHVNLVRGAEKEVANLARELNTVRNVLDDAERRGYKEKSVKDWLLRLEQTSYEMEDVLDEWNYAILKFQIEGDRSDDAVVAAPKNKVWSFVPSSSCLCCKKVVVRHGIAKKIIDVKQKLDVVLMEKDRYGFAISQPIADVSHNSWRDPTTSFADLESVCGRDSDRDALVTKIIGREEELGFQVVSIVGVGGLGKTTLAQIIYNDGRVGIFFALRIWICVSDPFDLAAIAKGILESMGRGSSANTSQLDVLLRNVEESISGRRFLLVLDDVWTEDSMKWEPLKASLRCGGKGSKVLVTTRNERVAISMGTIGNDIYHPQQLSPEDCWSLLRRISLSGRSEEESEKFEDIGKKIASKCKGLPLAVRVLGSLLQFKNSPEGWDTVYKSEIWELEEEEQQLFPHLLLSYNQLSPILKRCFSYCAVFPKDFNIVVDDLIGHWIAQGYLGYDDGNSGDMELKGQEYFQNLAMRSLFQDFERRGFDKEIISCKMHDVVHDFAQSLRKGRNSVGVKMPTCDKCNSSVLSNVNTYRSLVRYRHPCICSCLTGLRVLDRDLYSLHGVGHEMGHLIHLRWLALSWYEFSREEIKISFQLYNLQFLRIQYSELEEFPSEIGNLIQLSGLDLSYNSMLRRLPKEIGNLIQLKLLNLSHNGSLMELPKEIGNIFQLKHLDLSYTPSLKKYPEEIGDLNQLKHLNFSYTRLNELPNSVCGLINLRHLLNEQTRVLCQGVSELTNLRTLREFWGGRYGCELRWLKNLNLLSGSLDLNILLADDSKGMVEDAREADMRNKKLLQTLTMRFYDDMDEEGYETDRIDDGDKEMDEGNALMWMEVLDALEPHPNLQHLYINYYKGPKLWGWITSPFFNLRSIRLRNCNRLPSLPPLGKLPCLEEVEINDVSGFRLVGREFIGIQSSSNTTTTVGFPKLKKLEFFRCGGWEVWEDITEEEEASASTIMPCLTELLIGYCNRLTALPERLLGKKALSLERVEIRPHRRIQLVKRYKDRERAKWANGKLVLKVPTGIRERQRLLSSSRSQDEIETKNGIGVKDEQWKDEVENYEVDEIKDYEETQENEEERES